MRCKFMFTNGYDVCCKLYGCLGDIMGYSGDKCKNCKVERDTSMVMNDIKIKYLANIDKVEKLAVGDWVDLRAAKDTHINKGELCNIPLGIAMELPKGYEAIVAPRSSTFKKYGILMANSIGIIDNTYCGDNDEWCFPAYATKDVEIPANTRIAQFRIQLNQPVINFIEVDTLGNNNRGGFGSTGEK